VRQPVWTSRTPHATLPIVAGVKDRALGAAVRELRNERGMTQESLAHTANLALGTVTGVERATSAPDWATVRAIAKALDVSMERLGAAIDRAERKG
jgi:transcriptional regulator with XRE-family HTH domain